jgi:hypothetical protein
VTSQQALSEEKTTRSAAVKALAKAK